MALFPSIKGEVDIFVLGAEPIAVGFSVGIDMKLSFVQDISGRAVAQW